jgi:hypothetical protein
MIFINGIQRSGTNFAHTIYEGSEQYCHPYWKHDPKMEGIDPKCDRVICIIKHPITWVESICFRNQVDIVKWFPGRQLRNETDYLGPFKINLHQLINTYKLFYTSWLNYDKTELVHYEDLLVKHQIDKIPMSENWDPKRKAQYVKHKAPLVPQESKDYINKQLGDNFLNLIGY